MSQQKDHQMEEKENKDPMNVDNSQNETVPPSQNVPPLQNIQFWKFIFTDLEVFSSNHVSLVNLTNSTLYCVKT